MARLIRHLWLSVLVLGTGIANVLALYYAPREVPGPMLMTLPALVVVAAVLVDFTCLTFRK